MTFPDLVPSTGAPGGALGIPANAQGALTAPIARVLVEVPLPNLDRPFDYAVPEALAHRAVPGARVKVRFAGQLVSGYILDRVATTDHAGRLSPLAKVVSPEPVLDPAIATLARAVADRYAGTVADVLRLAIPSRHAAVEKELGRAGIAAPVPTPAPGPWSSYVGGEGLVRALADGRSPRAVWGALPGTDPMVALAIAVAATTASGRGSVVVLPDARDVDRLDEQLAALLTTELYVVLTAGLGPRERYRRWLAVRRGQVPAVIGTRAAMFAPVVRLGLAAVWDDGDDLHAEPHAPYAHVREVLALRAHECGAALLVGGYARTAEAQALVESGWARVVGPTRDTVRTWAPRVHASDDDASATDAAARAARLPSVVWQATKAALARGPVLFQVPRAGYLPRLACIRCRSAARCEECHGPLRITSGHAIASCAWCGRGAGRWHCPECGADRFRAQVVGAGRTAEELGRAFPSVAVRSSGGDSVLATVTGRCEIVVATPGAEPVAAGGYAAAILLDAWALLDRPELRAEEEAVRRWLGAASLVRPAADGGEVVVVADSRSRAVQALVRWSPEAVAVQALRERTALGFPPAARMAELVGAPAAVADLLDRLMLPAGVQVLGPVPHGAEGQVRALVRAPRSQALLMTRALRAGQGERSAHKEPDHVTVRVDPVDLA